jgi:hypothetical protein
MAEWVRANPDAGDGFADAVQVITTEFDLTKPFERVLADLDSRIDSILQRPRGKTLEECEEKFRFVYTRVAVGSMIPAYFGSLRSKPAEAYRLFARDKLAPGDAVITFNYDLALDRELRRSGKWSIGHGWGFPIAYAGDAAPADSPCKLLKLHGSIYWLGELFGGRRGFCQTNPLEGSLGGRPSVAPAAFEFLGYGDASDRQCHNGAVGAPGLIMPTANKKFFVDATDGPQWVPFWQCLWSQAAEALRASDEVYVIGYSMPEYDSHARELLATRIPLGVTIRVCCDRGTADAVESLRRLRSGDCNVRPACALTFEDWVRA